MNYTLALIMSEPSPVYEKNELIFLEAQWIQEDK